MKLTKLSIQGALMVLGVVMLAIAASWLLPGAQAVEVIRVVEGAIEEVVRAPARIQARVPVALSAR